MEGSNDIARTQYGLSSDYVIPSYMTSQDPPPYNAALQSVSPSQQVIMGEQLPDIDMKIRESEFKMKGEIIKLQNRLGKIERDVGLCCPDYDKLTTNIQSRFRGNKDRKILSKEILERNKKLSKGVSRGWVTIKDAADGIWSVGTALRQAQRAGLEGIDISIEIMKDNSNFGFWRCPKNNNYAGGIVQTKGDLEQILQKHITGRSLGWLCDFYVAPGAPLKLIKEKMNQGFTIEFEDENDKKEVEEMTGASIFELDGGKNKSKMKKSIKKKTRRKKTRRKSKKKKRRKK